MAKRKAESPQPGLFSSKPRLEQRRFFSMIPGNPLGAVEILAVLREAFSQHPDWRTFDEYQLTVLLFLHGYCTLPPDEADMSAALPLALEDRDGAEGAA